MIGAAADLHALGADDIKGSRHALNKLDDLDEAVISDTPGAVDEEDHVGLGSFAHCGDNTAMLMQSLISAKLWLTHNVLLSLPSRAGGTVAGGGGVGGSVGTSVGLTTVG